MITAATDSEFNLHLAQNENVVVKYYANWCGTCKLFAPKYLKISNKPEYGNILFLDINAEENPKAREFAGVKNLPYFAVIKNGKLIASDSTAKEESLEKMINKLFENQIQDL